MVGTYIFSPNKFGPINEIVWKEEQQSFFERRKWRRYWIDGWPPHLKQVACKKSQKSWPKGPFHLGRSLIIHATTVCVSWEENTSHPINGWMCKESPPLKKMWIKIKIQEPQKLEDKPIKLSHELMNQLKLYRRRISIWENFWIRDHNYIYMVPSI